MRIIGLDYGSKTVGVALSDELLITAQPFEIVRREQENKLRKTLARIEEIIGTYDVSLIILGLPKKTDNSSGERVEKTLEFKAMLERRTGLNVVCEDERYTTVIANNAMAEAGLKKAEWKEHVDSVAASLILQSYLDRERNNLKNE